MRDYEEKSYYEIQLDNKQLILVFLAGVTVCVLIFVLGVLVGKGKKEAEMAAVTKTETPVPVKPQEDTQPPPEAKPIVENKQGSKKSVVSEPKEKKDEDYSFYDLDKSESEAKLTKKVESKTPATETKTPPAETKTPPPQEKLKPAEKAKPAVESTVPVAASKEVKEEDVEVSTPAGSQRYTIQVMATASKSKAEQRLNELKAKGYPAYMDEDTGTGSSVYKVRVGKYADSASAKKDAVKLKEELNLDTWVAVLD